MPENFFFSTTADFPAWIEFDYQVLRENILRCRPEIFDLSIQLFARIWDKISSDLQLCGTKIVVGADSQKLAALGSEFERILRPGFKPGEFGCAKAGVISVLTRYSQLLALSNQAQSDDCRYRFLLRISTMSDYFSSSEFGWQEIVQRLGSLPMIDLVGFWLENEVGAQQRAILRRHLTAENSFFIDDISSSPLSSASWQILGLGKEVLPVPFSVRFWAYPFLIENSRVLLRIGLGQVNGLPERFPVMVENRSAEVIERGIDHCVIAIDKPGDNLPARCAGHLLGGNVSEPVSPHSWHAQDLKCFLQHWQELPVYMKDAEQVFEFLPVSVF